jgi:putative sigma-54 modulation protein
MNRKTKALEFVDEGYNIQITGRHVDITDSMKDYVMEKFSKIEQFVDRIIDVNIILDIQKLDHKVEIIFKSSHIKIVSQASSSDMYVSIDKAMDKLRTQLRRYKSKIQDHHAKSHAVIDMAVNVFTKPTGIEDELAIEQEDVIDGYALHPHEIVHQETLPLRTLNYDEAIMQMEFTGDAFMIFRNEIDRSLKVIYRRNDGNYGIIEPL